MLQRKPGALPGATALAQAHRHLPAAEVIAGITAALRLESVSPDVVAVEARKSSNTDVRSTPGSTAPQVIDPAQRRTTAGVGVPVDDRALPSVAPYDDLLGQVRR